MISNNSSPSILLSGPPTNNQNNHLMVPRDSHFSSSAPSSPSRNVTPIKRSPVLYNVSPISPMMAQSPLFRNMIDKKLFASIQKGFDEYEATKTQRDDIHTRVNK